jgi:uncharacterized protein (TIGR02646 family)
MRQINKNIEPNEFVIWKSANQEKIDRLIAAGKSGDVLWKEFPSSLSQDKVENDYSKAQLREALVQEQFYICCYCNDSIKGDSKTKIEHFLPREKYQESTFDYQNLLAACDGGEKETDPKLLKPRDLHCDSKKGNQDPSQTQLVTPFDADAHTHFYFTENGEIRSNSQQGKNTIAFLNLDCTRLNLRRKKVIETYLYDYETEDIDAQIAEISEPINGKLQAFCTAILSVLEKYK